MQVRVGQPHADVGVQRVQVGGDAAAVLLVQSRLQAFLDDASGVPDGAALGLDLAAQQRAAGTRHGVGEALEEQLDQLVRRGVRGRRLQADLLVALASECRARGEALVAANMAWARAVACAFNIGPR